jgi:hypothetical protein
MPARSNEFQRLIRSIYGAMAKVQGGRVTESAILKEPGGAPREVDILLEASAFGHAVRIAVECRDHARKADVQWIDELIGRFKNLGVHKVIAVAASGFTRPALQKAASEGIETRSLKECEETDWSVEFQRLGIGEFALNSQVVGVTIKLDPKASPEDGITRESPVEGSDGEFKCSVQDAVERCLHARVSPNFKAWLDKEFLPSCATLRELERSFELKICIPVSGTFVRGTGGLRHELKELIYSVLVEGKVHEAEVKHYRYSDETLITAAKVNASGRPRTLHVIQLAGSKQFHVRLD